MTHLLIPTDFSPASRAGIRFAIQLSRQQKAELTFVYSLHIHRLTDWTDSQYHEFALSERTYYRQKLEKFIAGICKEMPFQGDNFSCHVLEGLSPDLSILDYCESHPGIDYLCMGTKGAGRIAKIFGTNTGNLITHSPVPVIAVQDHYRTKPITSILYATDLRHYEAELKKVIAFAAPLKARVDLLHFVQPDEAVPDSKIFERTLRAEFGFELHFHFEIIDATRSLAANLKNRVQALKPSVVVLFTDQHRTLFEKIFFPSKAENLSFRLPAPLLVMRK